jgi:Predicted unusual protein kinase
MLQRLRSVVGDINRLRVILVVFFEEGFDVLIDRVRLSYLVPLTARIGCFFRRCRYSGKRKPPVSLSQHLRSALERLGPTFIKFGQLLSLRSDIIPPDYVRELQKLQSNAAPFPFDEVKKIIRDELGRPVKDVFKEFDPKPFAAASLSQVHRARLRDNTEVAVKVQRPHLRPIIENDIHILFFLASLAEKHIREIRHLRPVQFIKEFSEWTMRELDFSIEAGNAERFRENFGGDERFYFPEVYWDYTTKRVLTMEFIHGVDLSDAVKIKKIGDDPRMLALHGLELGLRQLFIHGFFQADPHPGNFFALKNNVLCLYDFGMVGYLDRAMRDKLANVFISFVDRDTDVTIEKMIELSAEHSAAASEEFVRKSAPQLSSWFYSKAEKKAWRRFFMNW